MVVRVPEERHVSLVRLDVVNYNSGCYPALSLTLCAERVLSQEHLAVLLPAGVIAALCAAAALCVIPLLSLLEVDGTQATGVMGQGRTARVRAWTRWFMRHWFYFLRNSVMAGGGVGPPPPAYGASGLTVCTTRIEIKKAPLITGHKKEQHLFDTAPLSKYTTLVNMLATHKYACF